MKTRNVLAIAALALSVSACSPEIFGPDVERTGKRHGPTTVSTDTRNVGSEGAEGLPIKRAGTK
jgi:hypothetical protein